jgi:hypothetical protein
LGIGLVPFSPLGHGLLTGAIRSPEQFDDDADFLKTNPRFTGENFQRNLRIADEVAAVAAEIGATPAQVALAWLLARGDDIAPIPGTKRVSRVEENTAADGIELGSAQIETLHNLTQAAREHLMVIPKSIRPERMQENLRPVPNNAGHANPASTTEPTTVSDVLTTPCQERVNFRPAGRQISAAVDSISRGTFGVRVKYQARLINVVGEPGGASHANHWG